VDWALTILGRRQSVLDDLQARADDALGWLAVERQARSYLRHLATWLPSRGFVDARSEMERRQDAWEAVLDRARRELSGFDADAVDEARPRLGLRLAVVGKGGAGKTVISSTLTRLLARRDRKVLAADLDTNPGLAISLGLPPTEAGFPPEAVDEHPGAPYGWHLASGLTPLAAVERFATRGPDGVHFLGLGKIGSTDKEAAKQSVVALVQLLLDFGEPAWDVVADLEAGPTTPFERYHAFADDVAVVVGPAWRSAMTARRLLPMVAEGRTTTVVANRFGDQPDHPGLAPAVRIPFDPDVAEAERRGLPPLDACPDSPAIAAIGRLADRLVAQEVRA
jgi:CO dehydrogenase maturation factor